MIWNVTLVPNELEPYDRLVMAFVEQGWNGHDAHQRALEQIVLYRRPTVLKAFAYLEPIVDPNAPPAQ